MKTVELTHQEFCDITDREESHFFDIKQFAVSGASVQKIAAAFSNADGGEFIVGIIDKKVDLAVDKRWEGIEDIEKFNAHLQNLFNIKPALNIQYEFLKLESRAGYALRVTVEKGTEIAVVTDGTIYVRNGAQSLPIKDVDRIQQLSFAKGASSFEDTLLSDIGTEQIVDSKEIQSFLADYSPKTDALEFCINQNLIDYKNWQPRTVSAILFHASPSSVIPRKCAIKITRYITKEDDPERDHLGEQFTIEGPSYYIIHETIRVITELMESVEVWTTNGLKKLEYPPEAIWETVVNSVIHRDYSISDDIRILVFDNRIEIISPGRLPGIVNLSNILDARYSRNAKLVRTLNRYKNPPNKDLGEGLNTTYQKMKEFGLKEPQIVEEGNYVKVTLPHAPLAAPTVAIRDFLKNHPAITNRQARDITGIKSENLVKIEFYKLRDEGLLEKVPGLAGPKSAWQLTPLALSETENSS
jgi:ATP-dependent DNA helicase RecG